MDKLSREEVKELVEKKVMVWEVMKKFQSGFKR